jgi:hypothetical protein
MIMTPPALSFHEAADSQLLLFQLREDLPVKRETWTCQRPSATPNEADGGRATVATTLPLRARAVPHRPPLALEMYTY